MKQRIFALLLVVALLVTAAVVMVNAADATIDYSEYTCPHCEKTGAQIEWKELVLTETGSKSQYLTTGHYYLTKDYSIPSQLRMTASKNYDVVIDLRGNAVDSPNDSRFAYADKGNTLSILDSVGGGVVSGSYSSGSGVLAAEGTVNLYGGTVRATGAPKSGVVFVATSGEFNMYGGTVEGGLMQLDTNMGGAIWSKGKLNIYGGTVIDGVANVGKSRGVHVSGGEALFDGGTVGEVIADKGTTVKIQGDSTIAKLNGYYTDPAVVTIGVLEEGASVKVDAPSGVIANTVDENCEAYIEAGYIDMTQYNKDGQKSLALDAEGKLRVNTVNDLANAMDFSDESNLPDYCPACGATNVEWKKFSEAYTATAGKKHAADAHYYLDSSIDDVKRQHIYADICLHLNNQNLTGTERVLYVGGSTDTGSDPGVLRIMGTGIITGGKVGPSSGIRGTAIDNAGYAYLYGGTYRSSNTHDRDYIIAERGSGRSMNIYEGAVIERLTEEGAVAGKCVVVTGAGTLNMYGGVIRNGSSSSTGLGGNITVLPSLSSVNTAKVNIYGGTVEGGSAPRGGNIYVYVTSDKNKVEINIYGGTIKDGVAATAGGNIGMWRSSTTTAAYNDTIDVNILGGVITGGQAVSSSASEGHGGSIYVRAQTDLVIKDAVITNATASYQGGLIHADTNCDVTIENSFLYGGTATNNIGGLIRAGANMYATNSVLGKGTSASHGGLIRLNAANKELKLTNCVLYGGETTGGIGGNISANQGATIVIKDSNLISGESSSSGGNLYAAQNANVTIEGSRIYGGKGANGGNIYVMYGSTWNITDSMIYNGEASARGGNIYLSAQQVKQVTDQTYHELDETKPAPVVTLTNATIKNGTAQNASSWQGANIFCAFGAETYKDVNGETLVVPGANLALDGVTITSNADDVMGYGIIATGDLTITGNTQINSTTNAAADVYLSNTGKLIVKSGFTGNVGIVASANHFESQAAPYGTAMIGDEAEGAFEGKLVLKDYSHPTASIADHRYGNPGIYADGTSLKVQGAAIVDGSKQTWYNDNAAAVAAYTKGYIKAYTNEDIALSQSEAVIDINGGAFQIDTTAAATSVYCFDSANDDYVYSNGAVTFGQNVTLENEDVYVAPNGNQYMNLSTEEGVYSFHPVDLRISSVSLRAGSAGVYYSGEWKCDDKLAEAVETVGVVVSLTNENPTLFGTGCLWTAFNKEQWKDAAVAKTGVIVSGIMKQDDNTTEKNVENANMDIYAAAYITLNNGDVMNSDPVVYSLKKVVEAVDAKFDDLVKTDAQRDALTKFYGTWKDIIDNAYTVNDAEYTAWSVANIKAAYEAAQASVEG